jgi:hypothetical protein
MKKLHLNPEELRVETFTTTPEEPVESGTVRGHDSPTPDGFCVPPTTECQLSENHSYCPPCMSVWCQSAVCQTD